MSLTELITLATAVLGAVTGIAGTWLGVWSIRRQIDQDRVKLTVYVRWGISTAAPGRQFLTITVVNRSAFAVTINEAGLLIDHGRKRVISPEAVLNNHSQLPYKMESRTRISILFPPEFMLDPSLRTAKCAYVCTDCGEQVEDSTNDIPHMIKAAQRIA